VCTIVTIAGVHPDFPLIVAANRDELYARPTGGPEAGDAIVVSGRDLNAGGTWMGATRGGFFAALTNQRQAQGQLPGLRSRGEVIDRALALADRAAVRAWVGGLDARSYNGFNLIYGDAGGLAVAYARHDEGTVELADLPPGIHGLANDRIGSTEFLRAGRAVELATPIARLPWAELQPALVALLADHQHPDGQPLQAICTHTPVYGTRSATIAAIGSAGLAHYLVSTGPPCTDPLKPVPGIGCHNVDTR
jgi:uncharacterized protein with NRDE domain